MLSLWTSSLMDVIAPPLPLKDELCWHWDNITSCFLDKDSECSRNPVEQTPIPAHLNGIANVLLGEEAESEGSSEKETFGPCLEHFHQQKMLNTLCTFAQTDLPPGIRNYVIRFLTVLISKSRKTLLAHGSFYNCVQKLIVLSSKVVASPYEQSEVQFLTCICEKIKENEDLLPCYTRDKFPMVSAITSLLTSPDVDVSTQAGDALLCLLSVCDDRAGEVIAYQTPFCAKITEKLVELYGNVPESLRPEDIEATLAVTNMPEDSLRLGSFPIKVRKYLSFLRWLELCDMIVHQSRSKLLTAVFLEQIKENFLDKCISRDLGDKENTEKSILTTVLLSNVLQHLSSYLLISTIGNFLCADKDQRDEKKDSSQNPIRDVLIERCRIWVENPRKSETESLAGQHRQLCIVSMQLLEELLSRPSEKLLNDLVIRYLNGRGYVDEERRSEHSGAEEQSPPIFSERSEDVSPGSSPASFFLSTSHIHRVLQYFMRLVPDELKSSESDSEIGYEAYVEEAQKQFDKCQLVCASWNLTKDCTESHAETINTSEDETTFSESQPEADRFRYFYEGDLLAMILDNMESMIHLPYEVNLQATSLLSKLALFPERHLNEYLLDPTVALSKNCRSLFSVLHKVVDELQINVQGIGNLQLKLRLTRNLLLGHDEGISIKSIDEGNSKVLEALIVTEEFCKELAAVAFVKYHNML